MCKIQHMKLLVGPFSSQADSKENFCGRNFVGQTLNKRSLVMFIPVYCCYNFKEGHFQPQHLNLS